MGRILFPAAPVNYFPPSKTREWLSRHGRVGEVGGPGAEQSEVAWISAALSLTIEVVFGNHLTCNNNSHHLLSKGLSMFLHIILKTGLQKSVINRLTSCAI